MKKAILFSLFLTLTVAAFAQQGNGCGDPDNYGSNASSTIYNAKSHTPAAAIKADFIVYPNPTKDAFALDAKSFDLGTAVKINLYNVMGQRVRTFTVGKETTYQVGDLNDGMYFVQFLDAKGKTIATRKLNKADAITRS
jgi:hypothetical protein